MASDQSSGPYLLLHLTPLKTGDRPERRIVEANRLRKFDYEEYKKNKNVYKEKNFKIKVDPMQKKRKCYDLHASDSYEDIKAIESRRFPIPVHTDSIIDTDSSKDGLNSSNDTEIVKAKKNRKAIKKSKNAASKVIDNEIIESYMNDAETYPIQSTNDSMHDEEDNQGNQNLLLPSSTPKKNGKEKIKNQQILKKGGTSQDNMPHGFKLYDDLYGFNNLSENVPDNVLSGNGVEGNNGRDEPIEPIEEVELRHNIKCNLKAYSDAFKAKTPNKCFFMLHQGVYGINELSKRCVRKQKNTVHLKVLSPKKSLAIEKEVYKFMRMREMPKKDIEAFFNNVNTAYHSVVTLAKSRVKTLAKLQAEEEVTQAQKAALRDQIMDPLAQ